MCFVDLLAGHSPSRSLRRQAARVLTLLAAALGSCIPVEPSPELRDAIRDYGGALTAFPGAEGFGVVTPAGRGGAVLRVTSLAADGPGSLRAALASPGPRTIVFEVAGIIELTDIIVVAEPFVTIAGQTAPSPGITIAGAGIQISTHDVLVQHLRVRVGDDPVGPDPGGRDALNVIGAADGSLDVGNVVIDHCSLSWAIDEGSSTWNPGVHDVTIRSSIVSENLSHSLHPEGEHSKGLLIGDHAKRVSVIGNLFAHNEMRNPFLKGDTSVLVANNVIYDPGSQAIHLDDPEGSGPTIGAVVGNRMVAGLDSDWILAMVEALTWVKSTSRIYMLGNDSGTRPDRLTIGTPEVFVDLTAYDESPVRVMPLTLRPVAEVEDWVLASAGARPADRDAVDRRVVEDVHAGTGHIIDSPSQVGGLDPVVPVVRPLELPDDPYGDPDGDGRTRLEDWLAAYATAVE